VTWAKAELSDSGLNRPKYCFFASSSGGGGPRVSVAARRNNTKSRSEPVALCMSSITSVKARLIVLCTCCLSTNECYDQSAPALSYRTVQSRGLSRVQSRRQFCRRRRGTNSRTIQPTGWSKKEAALVVPPTRLSTVGKRTFPVASSRVWNSLPHHVTSAPSLQTFRRRG